MSAEITDAIESNATGPKQVAADGVTVTQHSIADQIAAAKYVGATNAAANAPFGMKRARLVPPGAA